MADHDAFRQDLSTSLRHGAELRRAWFADLSDGPTGEDIKIIALFERLAAEVDTIDVDVFRRCGMLRHEHVARRFLQRRDVLLAQLGVTYVPKDASELVRWMDRQALARDPIEDGGGFAAGRSGGIARPGRGRGRGGTTRDRVRDAFATDFCAGFGIVAPMLAVWEVGQGIGQWRDGLIAQSRPAVQASILSASSTGSARNASMASRVVLSFRPTPSAPDCQLAVRLGPESVQPEAGATMMVVPRSADCERPLIVSEIGDPAVTFALAAAFLAGGLAALRLWGRLARRQGAGPRRLARDGAWSQAGAVIGRWAVPWMRPAPSRHPSPRHGWSATSAEIASTTRNGHAPSGTP